eukprot:7267-Heterococcus_DN1.PRE.1
MLRTAAECHTLLYFWCSACTQVSSSDSDLIFAVAALEFGLLFRTLFGTVAAAAVCMVHMVTQVCEPSADDHR